MLYCTYKIYQVYHHLVVTKDICITDVLFIASLNDFEYYINSDEGFKA